MQVKLNDLYLAQGYDIKEKIQKGKRVIIDFGNTVALGESTVEDLQEFVGVSNVEFTNLSDCVRDQLGIESVDVSQMTLFDAV